jgi:hypothetical protein
VDFHVHVFVSTMINLTKSLQKDIQSQGFNEFWLIDYLRFYVPLKNFSLIWRRHHYRWRAAKFRPMLGAQGLWAGRDLYRATPTMTRDLGFFGLVRRTAPFSRLLRHTRGCGGSILTRILTGFCTKSLNLKLYEDPHNCSWRAAKFQCKDDVRLWHLSRLGGVFIVPHLMWNETSVLWSQKWHDSRAYTVL